MKFIIATIFPKLLDLLTPDVTKTGVDAFLDVIEDAAARSENTIDDKVVLPICAVIRVALGVPDND